LGDNLSSLSRCNLGQSPAAAPGAVVDEQIDLAEARIRRGERPSVVFAVMRAAVARMRKATY
jgi:hypothetical protein